MKKILVVEDDAISQEMVAEILTQGGYKVLKASNAMDAIRVVDRDPPHLILMDIKLPGANGLEIMHRLKEDHHTEHIKVVALTALTTPKDRKIILSAGCDGHIPKPVVDPQEFINTVSAFLK